MAATHTLASLYDFENREAIFPGVHRSYKFSLVSISSSPVAHSQLVFFATRVEHLTDPQRRFALSADEISLFNPNTRTMPIFRTRSDAELTKSIYHRVPVLVEDRTGYNPWSVSFLRMFDMTNDSYLFRTRAQLDSYGGRLVGNQYATSAEQFFPMWEDWLMHIFDHRYQSDGGLETTEKQHADASHVVQPRYWIQESQLRARTAEVAGAGAIIGFRNRTRSTDSRTVISALLPLTPVGNTVPVLLTRLRGLEGLLQANLASLVLDYLACQKIGGLNLNFFIVKQLAILPPSAYTRSDTAFVLSRVLELVYTAWDMAPFAADVWADADEVLRAKLEEQHQAWIRATGGHEWDPPDWAGGDACPAPFAPARWDEERRALLRAELDAYYARLYGLTRDELRYILDPKDVYGPGFPSETFRALKEKEERTFGEYRTRRLVLEAWDRLEAELGPVVVRNYREEGAGSSESRVGVAESSPTYKAAVTPAAPTRRPQFGAPQASHAAPSAPDADPGPLFGGAAEPARPAPHPPAPRPPAPAQPVLIPSPPQGDYAQRLKRVLGLRGKETPEAIGELVAALGDEDGNIRWLAASVLQSIGGGAVIATLKAYIEQAPSAAALEEAEKLLGKLVD